jgi:hypothetical protein
MSVSWISDDSIFASVLTHLSYPRQRSQISMSMTFLILSQESSLGVDLDSHIGFCIVAMQRCAGDLGLELRSGDSLPGSCMRVRLSRADSKTIKTNSYWASWKLAGLPGAEAKTVPGNIDRLE